MLRHKSVLVLAESVNSDDSRSRSPGTTHLDEFELYMTIMEEPSIFIRAVSNFAKNATKPAPFHVLITHTSGKKFTRVLRAVLFDYHTDSASEFVDFLDTPRSHACTTSIPLLQLFFSCMRLHSYDPRDCEGARKALPDCLQL